MQHEAGERDMVMLQHKFEIEHKDGRVETRTTSTLRGYGDPEDYSSMTKIVGVLCDVACLMVLGGRIKETCILAPVDWQLAEPLLIELKEKWGIEMIEKTIQYKFGSRSAATNPREVCDAIDVPDV